MLVFTARYKARGVVARIVGIIVAAQCLTIAPAAAAATIHAVAAIDAAGRAKVLQARLGALRVGIGAMLFATAAAARAALIVIQLLLVIAIAEIAILAGHLVTLMALMTLGGLIIHARIVEQRG